MLSPLAIAATPCVMPEGMRTIAPCCEIGEPCGMPDMPVPCAECWPALPSSALPAAISDVAPPLLVSFEQPILITIEAPNLGTPFVVVVFHPPPPTLLALGTQLTC